MTAPYTPDTDEVREVWVWQDYENGYHGPCPRDPAEFNRWLAEHYAEVRDTTLEETSKIAEEIAQGQFNRRRNHVAFGADLVRKALVELRTNTETVSGNEGI